jgi:hypothetical protein
MEGRREASLLTSAAEKGKEQQEQPCERRGGGMPCMPENKVHGGRLAWLTISACLILQDDFHNATYVTFHAAGI